MFGELPALGRVGPEDALRILDRSDDDANSAHDVVTGEQFGAGEPFLGDGDRSVVHQLVGVIGLGGLLTEFHNDFLLADAGMRFRIYIRVRRRSHSRHILRDAV